MKSFLRWTIAVLFCCTCLLNLAPTVEAAPLAQMQSFLPQIVAVDATVDFRNAADEKRREAGNKIDLNNAPVRAFISLRGMYPTLASKIVNNSPYKSVEDIFNIPDLSDRQKETLKEYMDLFTVTDPSTALNYGFDRINNGIYK
jgi:photosystem II PsbU protein